MHSLLTRFSLADRPRGAIFDEVVVTCRVDYWKRVQWGEVEMRVERVTARTARIENGGGRCAVGALQRVSNATAFPR